MVSRVTIRESIPRGITFRIAITKPVSNVNNHSPQFESFGCTKRCLGNKLLYRIDSQAFLFSTI